MADFGYTLRRKFKLRMRAIRRQREAVLGHKMTGRQWVRYRRQLKLNRQVASG